MKFHLFLFFFITFFLSTTAQKKSIDSVVFERWPALNSPVISANGKYVAYTVEREANESHKIVVQATESRWRKEIAGGLYGQFTEDNQWLICNLNADSLCLVMLGKEQMQYYSRVQRYEVGGSGLKRWIAMQQIGNGGSDLLLKDLTKGTTTVFPGVINFAFCKSGKSLAIERADPLSGKTVIEWINTETSESKAIFKMVNQSHVENLSIDAAGKKVLFLTSEQNKDKQSEKSVWYYQVGMEQAVEKLNSQTPGIPKGVLISNATFSRDGNRLFFDMKGTINTSLKRSGVMVDIWSYRDDKLQAHQLNEVNAPVTYKGVINLDKDKVIIVQRQNEKLYENREGPDDYFLLTTNPCYFEENNWRAVCRVPLYLVNYNDGTRCLIKDSMVFSDYCGFTADGKYVLYYDPEKQAYFSYAIESRKTVNITQNIPFPICDIPHSRAGLPKPYSLFRAWLPGKGVIINDQFDIWLLDPAGINQPVCLTKCYGRSKGIRFQIISSDNLIKEQQVILLAFRQSDKANGFYSLNLAKPGNPTLLTMGPYLYCWESAGGALPIKATAANSWIVSRESELEFPNYFFTKDLKSLVQVSNLQPQSNYNWLSTELHEWNTFEGKKLHGILYKPENFDPNKKYPIIFHFYEEKSDELHKYIVPGATEHNINIPHFVSNGYLIFVPDIHYSIGTPMESIYNSVVSSAQYLCKFPWVDSTKMGLQGHSFGGYEVNALVSRTNIFAAAAEAAGQADFVSGYGSVSKYGYSNQYKYEFGQSRIQATLWERPDLYVANSPIFYANKVTTPLLIMHCKRDESVSFEQGIEWYTALRRLGKRVWMLQYDNGGHQLAGKEAKDYTIRLMQFFDHYLKAKPAPKWMTHGIPATLKGIETGFELDTIYSKSLNGDK